MNRRLKGFIIIGGAWAATNVVAGALFRRRRRRYAGTRRQFLVVHGGEELRPSAEEMTDAVASVFMGGLVLDLRPVPPPTDPLNLDVRVVMGGLEVQLPRDWRVAVEVTSNLGGVEDDRPNPPPPGDSPHLRIRGRVTLGGIELTHG
ncbi:MAG: hypothetical protein EA421_07690 [Gemmatimonadales bacterium]|nr:MAG: hypothetical protein EA421_07690 [Gemmatimonadales bacterium]